MKSEENDGAADECRDSFSMNKKEDTAPQRIFSRDADRNTCVSSFVATTTTSRGKTAEKGPSPQPEETAENSRRQLLLLTSDEDHSARHRSPQCEQTLEASSSSPIKTSTSSNSDHHTCTLYCSIIRKIIRNPQFDYQLHVTRRCHYYSSYTENRFSVFLRRFCRNGLRKFLEIMQFL